MDEAATEKFDRLVTLFKAVQGCQACSITNVSKSPLLIRGSMNAKVLFISDVSSLDDERTGVPFSGKRAIILDLYCSLMELSFDNDAGKVPAAVMTSLGHTPIMNRNIREASKLEKRACLFRYNGILNILQPSYLILLGNSKKFFEANGFRLGSNTKNKTTLFTLPDPSDYAVENIEDPIVFAKFKNSLGLAIFKYIAKTIQEKELLGEPKQHVTWSLKG